MRGFPRAIALLMLVALTATVGRLAAQAPVNPEIRDEIIGSKPSLLDGQDVDGELKISIRLTTPESTDSLNFHVTFENASDKDTLLNLGQMLGNGKAQLPDAVRLILTDSLGQSRELRFSDKKYPGIAGRVDDYAVPLRAGSAYSLNLSLKDYWCPKSEEFTLELKPGERYGVRAEFNGRGALNLNSDTEGLTFMPFWNGKVKSDVAKFQIREQG